MLIFAIHPHVIITYTYAQHCKGDSCKLSFLFAHKYFSSDRSQQVVIYTWQNHIEVLIQIAVYILIFQNGMCK